MAFNIEIKAKVDNLENIVEKLKEFQSETLFQKDIFINFGYGRLKLRECNTKKPQIIFYEREDSYSPRPSHFKILTYKSKERYITAFKNYKKKYGIRGVVEKKRIYYRTADIRIHLDCVKKLGYFVEVEVVCKDDHKSNELQKKANEFFFHYLNIPQENVVTTSYIDLILKQNVPS